MYAWTSGHRAVPQWVVDTSADVAKDRAIEHDLAGKAARSLALELRGLTATDLAMARWERFGSMDQDPVQLNRITRLFRAPAAIRLT